jgi:molybdopterin/thiamine biosynthesis adenylyltransferase
MKILSKIIKIKDSVDVYQIPVDEHSEKLQFYKINTRERSSIRVAKEFSLILSKLDGKLSLGEVLAHCGFTIDEAELSEIVDYLLENGYAISIDSNFSEAISMNNMERYIRQINYFDDLVVTRSGMDSQCILAKKAVVVIGCGAVGGAIATHLVRAGVTDVTLVDYKKVRLSDAQRHLYYRADEVGNLKTEALARYLRRINSVCNVSIVSEKLIPNSDLDKLIGAKTDVVINSADEPYIGHTTLKLGRYLWPRNIALYVAGGFDAHAMSTGEFIINGLTPCADCCSNTFRVALKDWTPTYVPSYQKKTDLLIGGAGGLASQALFSASIGAKNIISYLIDDKTALENFEKRGEYLIDQGKMTWIDLTTQEGCDVCSIR